MKNLFLFFSLFMMFFACGKPKQCESSNTTIENLNYEITSITSLAEDDVALLGLFEKITTLSESENCSEENNWEFIAYGSKACGGPIGYIAYSKCINTTDFFNKVTVFSELQNQYNSKHGVISTCDIPPVPISVKCINDKPVLVY